MKYNRNNPFLASIKERYSLCQAGSTKKTLHLVLDLENSDITYNVGDSLAIFPKNDPALVERTIHALTATGEEAVIDKRSKETYSLRYFLTEKASITDISRKLASILEPETDPKEFKDHEIWDAIETYKPQLSVQELCDLLMPLLPRFYSIASSMAAVNREVHLTVAMVEYETKGQQRFGVCTHYLCNLAPLHTKTVPIYVQPHRGFTIPEHADTSIIMVGPGTGIAPFRAFMQERIQRNAPGKNWLFFGERYRSQHFFYEEYWKELEAQSKLRLDLAFSRDQEKKFYVQHAMEKQGQELFNWLEEGAHLFVCGDASRMAKDVDTTLHHIVKRHGNRNEEQAKEYVKQLWKEKRYLRDVY